MDDKWIPIDKDDPNKIPNGYCWLFNVDTGKVEFFAKSEWLQLDTYSHYIPIKKPNAPSK